MASFNSVTVVGNLTRDPETRTVGATTITGFGLAMNRKYRKADGTPVDEPIFLDVEAWGKTGDIVAQYVKKGQPLLVRGRLKSDTWNDKATGDKRSKIVIVAEEVQMLGGREDAKETATVNTAPRVPAAAADDSNDEPPF